MSVRILTGDCRTELAKLPDQSVHCCVTSPPYFGLRDYGHAGQIGLEATPDAFVAEMVAVFREVRRVLRDDGTLWLNLGDSYGAVGGDTHSGFNARYSGTGLDGGKQAATGKNAQAAGSSQVNTGLRPKNLIGIPWRVAFALQQPYYTGSIKSLEDRIWLAAIIDGEGCFFIHKRKAGTSAYSNYTRSDGTEASYSRTADTYGVGLEICNTSKVLIDRIAEIIPGGTFTSQDPEQNGRRKQTIYRWRLAPNDTKRLAQELYPHIVAKQHQARLIFSCPSNGDAGAAAHQAMMDLHNGAGTSVDFAAPPSLFEPGYYLRQDIIWGKPNPMPESVTDRCTKAHEYIFLMSKSARYFFDAEAIAEDASGRDPGNKTPHKHSGERFAETKENLAVIGARDTRNKRSVWTVATSPFSEAHFATFPPDLIEPCIKAGCPVGGTVLDPFGGAGTTGLVADRLQRSSVLIELNPEYAAMAERRIYGDAPLFVEAT